MIKIEFVKLCLSLSTRINCFYLIRWKPSTRWQLIWKQLRVTLWYRLFSIQFSNIEIHKPYIRYVVFSIHTCNNIIYVVILLKGVHSFVIYTEYLHYMIQYEEHTAKILQLITSLLNEAKQGKKFSNKCSNSVHDFIQIGAVDCMPCRFMLYIECCVVESSCYSLSLVVSFRLHFLSFLVWVDM